MSQPLRADPRRARVPALLLAAVLAAVLAGAVLAGTAAAAAEEEARIECHIAHVAADGIYVDAGHDAGLRQGETAAVERGGERVARVEVTSVARGSAFLRFMVVQRSPAAALGEEVVLVLDRAPLAGPSATGLEDGPGPPAPAGPPAPEGPPALEREPSPTIKQPGAGDDFVPLLAPPDMGSVAYTDAENVFQGRLSLRHRFQLAADGDQDYSLTNVRSSGSVERIDGSAWALEWSGDASYRGGDAFEDVRDYEETRLEVYRLSLFRRFDDTSFVRTGRFIPRELPSAGYLDGAQGEKPFNEHLRLGGMVGFKPTRDDLNVVVDEPTLVPYATLEAGGGEAPCYTGTLGLLFSLYRGEPDRFAILAEQVARIGRLSLSSSSEVDVYINDADLRDGVRLTRWDLFASHEVSPSLTLRAGLDRYERPGTEAENALINPGLLDEDEFFDRGYWRCWAGASHELSEIWHLSEEVSVTDSETDDYTLRWNVALTRSGLPGLPEGSVTLSAYNLEGDVEEGYGGRLSAQLPFLGHRLFFEPSAAFRWVEEDTFEEHFRFTDVSLRASWILSPSWSVAGGAAWSTGDDANRVFADLSVTFRW